MLGDGAMVSVVGDGMRESARGLLVLSNLIKLTLDHNHQRL